MMAYIRKKTIRRRYGRYGSNKNGELYQQWIARQTGLKPAVEEYEYYYLVESYREGGKVRQKTLACLGHYPTLQEAIKGYIDQAERLRKLAENFAKRASSPGYERRGKKENWRKAGEDYSRMAEKAAQRAHHLEQFLDLV